MADNNGIMGGYQDLYLGAQRTNNYWIKNENGVYSKTTVHCEGGELDFIVYYEPGYLDVFRNGEMLTKDIDYIAVDGMHVQLTQQAAPDDLMVFISWTVESASEAFDTFDKLYDTPEHKIANKYTRVSADGTQIIYDDAHVDGGDLG